jgi:SAM-dependent methyltransferase
VSQTAWDVFFARAAREVLQPGARVLDIGAGLRADPARGNRLDPHRAWMTPLLRAVRYDVLDPVATYHPSLVGDLQALPIRANTYDAVICHAVLEHVPRPWEGVAEILRVLKPRGVAFLYVPFLIPYHAEPGYYADYWRFTGDGLASLLRAFAEVRMQAVRGPAETLAHMLPPPLPNRLFERVGRQVDRVRRSSGKQVSGFFATARKPEAIDARR